jgi:hypothetical protein
MIMESGIFLTGDKLPASFLMANFRMVSRNKLLLPVCRSFSEFNSPGEIF